MSIQLIGGTAGDVPFNRTFFNVTLADMISGNGKDKAVKLTLYLSDGTTLDVCSIDELTDGYVAARAYQKGNDSCDVSVQLIPYGLIYRIEISPKVDNTDRVGFHFKTVSRRSATTRRSR
jgi:hypothetical protein